MLETRYEARLGASTGRKYSITSTNTWKNDKYKYKYWIFKSSLLEYKYKYFKKYLSTSNEAHNLWEGLYMFQLHLKEA